MPGQGDPPPIDNPDDPPQNDDGTSPNKDKQEPGG